MTAANDNPDTRLHQLFDRFLDEAIWEGFTLSQIESCVESGAAQFFRDYERFLTIMGRFHHINGPATTSRKVST